MREYFFNDFSIGYIYNSKGKKVGEVNLGSGRVWDANGRKVGEVGTSSGRVWDANGRKVGEVGGGSGRIWDASGHQIGTVEVSVSDSSQKELATFLCGGAGLLLLLLPEFPWLL